MTEKETRLKYCPMARTMIKWEYHGEILVGLCNRHHLGFETCLGSNCAMWTWMDENLQGPEEIGFCGLKAWR